MKLTDAKIRALKPTEKDQMLFDGGGLFLQVSSKGAKTWKYMFSFGGKPGLKITLGRYPELSLAEAREKHRYYQKIRNQGTDPRIAQKQERSTLEGAYEVSCRNFKKVSEEWLKEYEGKASPSTLVGKKRMLTILNNRIGDTLITDVM